MAERAALTTSLCHPSIFIWINIAVLASAGTLLYQVKGRMGGLYYIISHCLPRWLSAISMGNCLRSRGFPCGWSPRRWQCGTRQMYSPVTLAHMLPMSPDGAVPSCLFPGSLQRRVDELLCHSLLFLYSSLSRTCCRCHLMVPFRPAYFQALYKDESMSYCATACCFCICMHADVVGLRLSLTQ